MPREAPSNSSWLRPVERGACNYSRHRIAANLVDQHEQPCRGTFHHFAAERSRGPDGIAACALRMKVLRLPAETRGGLQSQHFGFALDLYRQRDEILGQV